MQKEMQNKITRLLYELNQLDKGSVRLADLAAELGVSLRTVQRDMNTILEAEFPICSPQGGVYAFMEGCSLEKMSLTDTEASMLVFMSEIAGTLGSSFGKSFELLKMRLMGKQQESPFFVKISHGASYPDNALTKEIAACVSAREKMTVCYRGGKRACYPVRPLKIAWIDGFWYLLALTDDDKLLKFNVEKITSAKPLGKFFKPTKDIEKMLRESTNIWFEQERPISVKLEISADVARYFKAKEYFPLQKVEKEYADGRLLLSCRAASIEEIAHTVLHWLPEIKVLEPGELSAEVKRRIDVYLKGK